MAPHESTTAKGRDLEAGLEVQAAPSGATDSHSPGGDATSGGAGDGHGHGHDEKTGPDWKGDVLQCCGEGVDVKTDFRLCMKALVCPCLYYGSSMRRALLLNGYYHCIMFIIGTDLFWFVGSIMRAKCANPALPPPSPKRPARVNPSAPSPPPSPPPLAAIAVYNNCIARANTTTGYLAIITGLFMLYSTYRRYQMRKKFGFPTGTWKIVASDLYAWVCCTLCAVCQEARTLSYNNVMDGRWLGPQVTLKGLDIASELERAQAAAAEGGRLRSARSYTLYAGYGGANQGIGDDAAAPAGLVEDSFYHPVDTIDEEEGDMALQEEEDEGDEQRLLPSPRAIP